MNTATPITGIPLIMPEKGVKKLSKENT